MVKFRRLTALILSILLVLTASPLSYATGRSAEFANSDCEGYFGGLFYFASNEDISFAYRETAINEDREAITEYYVDSIAVYGGYAYVLTGKTLRKINVNTLEDSPVYSSRAGIDRFALGAGKIYLLTGGSITSLNTGGTLTTVVASGKIIDFWLENAGTLSYMTNEDYIHTLDLASGDENIVPNYATDLGENIPLYNPSDGTNQPSMDLGSLQSKFPAGKYWNHVGSSSNNPNGYTSSPCTHHSGNCDYYGGCGCNSFSSAIQCMGYAFKCAYDVYGSYTSSWSSSYSTSALDSVKAGDVIRYRNDGHSIFVTGVSGSTITYTDCNSDGHCIIKWNRTIDKSTVRSSFTYLRSAPYAAPGNTSTDTKYTVTYNANGGSCSVKTATIKSGDPYGDLPAAEREGYDLLGWYTSASGGTPVSSTDKVTSNTTLYAQWKIKTYYITFDKNGGNYAPDDFSKVYGESKTIGTRTPSRDGFTFVTWNTAKDGSGTSYKPGSVYSANEDATLYAIWKGKSIQINLNANGGTFSGSNYMSVVYGEPYGELPAPERTGYDFTGWHISSETGTPVTSETIVEVATSHRLVASWKVKVYTVTYNANGGKNTPDSQSKEYGRSITLRSDIPSREHYSFTGWYTAPDSSGTKYEPGTSYSANADLYLFAGWKGEEYTVNFNVNGGEGTIASQTKVHGTTLTLTSVTPEKTGHTFVEWNTKSDGSGKGFASGGNYNNEGNTTLYAIWEITKYKVTYDANGGENAPAASVFEYDSSTVISSTVPTRTGFNFLGWFTNADGTGTQYTAGTTYAKNENLKLYAAWEREKYPVTFNANGGKGAPETQYKEYEVALAISDTVPAKAGYDFTGWNTLANGTGKTYQPGETYTENKALSLCAQWAAATYTVTFNSNGSAAADTTARFKYGTVYSSLPVISRRGYTFLGWYTSPKSGTKINEGGTVSITADSVFYAHWSANTYTLTFNPAGGECATEKVDVTYGTAYSNLPAASKTGFVFAGWFDSDGNEIAPGATVLITKDTSVTAKWVNGAYTVTLDPVGGECETVSLSANYGDTVSGLPVPERAGFNFGGWADESGALTGKSFTMPAKNTALTAIWTPETYAVILDPGQGSLSGRSVNVNYLEPVGTLPKPVLGGSEFLGWFAPDGKEITASTVYSYNKAITLTAKYADVTAGSVTFTADGNTVAVVANSKLPSGAPAVPSKEGYSGKWSEYEKTAQGDVAKAVYTPAEYTVSFITGDSTVTKQYAAGDYVTGDGVTAPEGYVINGFDREMPFEMPAENITVTAVLTPLEYTAIYINEGKVWSTVKYTAQSLPAARLPSKDGYSVTWDKTGPVPGGMTVFAVYTPVNYTATFRALGKTVAEMSFNIETEALKEPAVPVNNGYSGRWESYTLGAENITVNAVYAPNTYTVTFVAMDKEIAKVSYAYGAESINEPAVPARAGYTGSWAKYTLGYKDSTVNALYRAIQYTATFVANGKVIATVPFTVESPPVAPAVPQRSGYTAKWSDYTIMPCDMTITAKYIPMSGIYILSYMNEREIDYMTTITFRAKVSNTPEEYEIHWLINGEDTGTGNGDGTVTIKEARSDFTVCAQMFYDGEGYAKSETEKVNVKNGFFARLNGFFRKLFHRLHNITQ